MRHQYYWFVSDVGEEHLETTEGLCRPLPCDLNAADLVRFATEEEAQAFCLGMLLAKGYHVKPLRLRAKQWLSAPS